MARDFQKWLNTFTNTIRTSSYFVDWNKVLKNVEKYKDELNILNGIIGSNDIENEFRRIVIKYPQVVETIPILLAYHYDCIQLSSKTITFKHNDYNINEILLFMHESGLFKFLVDKNIKNLIDYLTGVEVGLDSNARKNRGGHLMEDMFEEFLIKSKIVYDKEIYANDIEKKYSIDLSAITNNKKTKKRFDFCFRLSNGIVYAVEVNFYSGSGSKLNETARSYKEIALASKGIKNFKFMWITDGAGWHGAKNNLKETFDVLDNLYNINNLKNGVLTKLTNWKANIYKEIDTVSKRDIELFKK